VAINANDRFAIQDIFAAYCVAVDRNDARGWADLFTDDGKRIYDENPGAPGRASRTVSGREELIKLQLSHPLSGVRHWQSLPMLVDHGEYVASVSYGMVIDISRDPPFIAAHFTCAGELVKVADGTWRIRSMSSSRDLLHDDIALPR
jgi:hypothetical protein